MVDLVAAMVPEAEVVVHPRPPVVAERRRDGLDVDLGLLHEGVAVAVDPADRLVRLQAEIVAKALGQMELHVPRVAHREERMADERLLVEAIDEDGAASRVDDERAALEMAYLERAAHVPAIVAELEAREARARQRRDRLRLARLVVDVEERGVDVDPVGLDVVGDALDGVGARAEQVGEKVAVWRPDAHAARRVVVLAHPQIVVGIDRDPRRLQHPGRIVAADPRPPAGLPDHAELLAGALEHLHLHGLPAVGHVDVAFGIRRDGPRRREPLGDDRRRPPIGELLADNPLAADDEQVPVPLHGEAGGPGYAVAPGLLLARPPVEDDDLILQVQRGIEQVAGDGDAHQIEAHVPRPDIAFLDGLP